MTEAEQIVARAREREDARAQAYVPPDYKTANKVFSKQKGKLTRAINSGDPDKVILACRDAVRDWGQPPFNGAWPDAWSRWQNALDDALGGWRSHVDLRDLEVE